MMDIEVARLQRALRFYAHPENWQTHITLPDGTYPGREVLAHGAREHRTESSVYYTSAVEEDAGRIARKALEIEPESG